LIRLHSVIAWPAPKARGTAKSHGSALGSDEVAALKRELRLDPDKSFDIAPEVLEHTRKIKDRGRTIHATWDLQFRDWSEKNPSRASLLERLQNRALPALWDNQLPIFSSEKEIATRAASGKIINALAKVLPEFWGGSADLAESNNTTIEDGLSFLPALSSISQADPYGRIIHFGIREHAMGAIINGIALHGLTRPFGGTFLVFSDYMRGAVRLAALMNIPSTFIWTHDSIGLGEDGPTHQPIEHLLALRAIPNLSVIRPADANETSIAWREIIRRGKPAGLILSRQNLPVIDRTVYASAEGVSKGGYILSNEKGPLKLILISTGSEVHLALKAQEILEQRNIGTRVISLPSWEWFAEQSEEYREEVLPAKIRARVSIEAGTSMGWREYVGDEGEILGIDHFGESASAGRLFAKFGFTTDNIVLAAERTLRRAEMT
jgi:transketolase